MTRFRECYPGLQKSPQDSPRAHVSPNGQPRNFHSLRISLQPFTDNESLVYKHKNNVVNSNIPFRVTTVDRPHFAAVCATRTRA